MPEMRLSLPVDWRSADPPNDGQQTHRRRVQLMENKHVLLVEPDAMMSSLLSEAIHAFARVNPHAHFTAARSDLRRGVFDLIITNLRLGPYNGLHLAHLAATESNATRSIVYTAIYEPLMAREIQRAGAFYETAGLLPHTIPAYLTSNLPSLDRRNFEVRDRRRAFRGGRRRADVQNLHSS
jgi:DNA-binding NtrC family response regulator